MDDIEEVSRALKETSDDWDIESMMLNFAFCERVYNTPWRDNMTDVQRRPPDRLSTRIAS